jgi:hypothetical protein
VKDHLHWPPKKRWFNVTLDSIFQFWNCCGPFWEICSYTKDIWKEYKLLCDKQYMPLKITKGLWLKWLTLNLGLIVVVFNYKTFINAMLLALVDQMTIQLQTIMKNMTWRKNNLFCERWKVQLPYLNNISTHCHELQIVGLAKVMIQNMLWACNVQNMSICKHQWKCCQGFTHVSIKGVQGVI